MPVVVGVLDRQTQRPVFLEEYEDMEAAQAIIEDVSDAWDDAQRYWIETVHTTMDNFLDQYIVFRNPLQGVSVGTGPAE